MGMVDQLYQAEKWGKGEDVVLINEMSSPHIKNVVSWIWRNRDNLKMGAEAEMAFGMKPRGEAAQDAFDAAFEGLLNQSSTDWFVDLPIIMAFRDELARRGEESTSAWLTRMIDNRS
jgi:hypothetical protein